MQLWKHLQFFKGLLLPSNQILIEKLMKKSQFAGAHLSIYCFSKGQSKIKSLILDGNFLHKISKLDQLLPPKYTRLIRK